MTPADWDDIDRRIAALLAQRAIDREVRHRIQARRLRREVIPILVCLAGALACLAVLFAWSVSQ